VIKLKPDAKAVDCKIYPLLLGEQMELNKFLEENLKVDAFGHLNLLWHQHSFLLKRNMEVSAWFKIIGS
jgi:hypothetical protein